MPRPVPALLSPDKADSGVRWIRSVVVAEESSRLGTACIYEAESPEAIRAHTDAAGMPADETCLSRTP
jgi:hypothetical protein